jgi:hypothetical protein
MSVEWFNVRHFSTASCGGGVDSNSFCIRLNYTNGDIFMDYAYMGLCQGGGAPSTDQVVGISPGGGISLANNVDLSTNPSAVGATDALYEDFSQGIFGPFDLGGGLGGGINIGCYLPTGGNGIGPYNHF